MMPERILLTAQVWQRQKAFRVGFNSIFKLQNSYIMIQVTITKSIALFKTLLLLYVPAVLLSSCEKYLDAKPNQSLAIPSTVEDMQALMDNAGTMNVSYSPGGEMSADDLYLTEANWAALTNVAAKNFYVWDPSTTNNADWRGPYRIISIANLVLDNIDDIEVSSAKVPARDKAKGTALFFRSFAYLQLAQHFMAMWDSSQAMRLQGIPLRLHAEIVSKSVRTSMKETFDQIVADGEAAIALLPKQTAFKTQPTKVAGWAQMARVYLYMQQYRKAEQAADSSLALYNKLLDYNSYDTTAAISFKFMNDEVSFQSRVSGGGSLGNNVAMIDTNLYNSYAPIDLRKKLFFASKAGGGYVFKGSYLGELTAISFNGFTSAELLLIKAETAVRNGDVAGSLLALNKLLQNRYRKNYFTPVNIQDPAMLLRRVLDERRKEMVFRAQRWADLKRLNTDARFAVNLTRKLSGTVYSLPANDPRYALLIPQDVIDMSGMEQNPR
jgi:tetratricopeptide (TPR) repeat protein